MVLNRGINSHTALCHHSSIEGREIKIIFLSLVGIVAIVGKLEVAANVTTSDSCGCTNTFFKLPRVICVIAESTAPAVGPPPAAHALLRLFCSPLAVTKAMDYSIV